jgi:hypothetical protein
LRKARENRKARHAVSQDLKVIERLDEVAAEVAESSAKQDISRIGGWKKQPDIPLADHITQQKKLRARHNPTS